jgi:outer membrane protein assembly factor BamB
MNKNKTSIAIALILMLTFAGSMVIWLPIVNAEEFKESYAVIMAEPDPVGVGQTILIVFGISEPLTSVKEGWEGLTVSITKPDDTTETLGPFKSDPTGTTFTSYVPTQLGTYYFQTSFPGMWWNTTAFNRYYKPSTSQKLSITVQEEPVPGAPEAPLPTEYWTRPINAENREWWQIAGNWLMAYYDHSTNAFNPYTAAPNSSHIMWTKEIEFGGIVGGNYSDLSYYPGESYENKWDPPVVMNGRLYYNKRLGSSSRLGMACVDLDTGEELWFKNGVTLSFGQLLNFDSPNQHGVIPYLWSVSGTTYQMYDAFTGEWILDISDVPRGTTAFGSRGEILNYRLFTQGGVLKLSLWNQTHIDDFLSFSYGPDSPMWRPPQGATLNGTKGIMWTVNATPVAGSPSANALFVGDVLVAIAYSPEQLARARYTQEAGWMHYGFSLKPGQEGQLMWAKNRTVTGNVTMCITGARGTVASDGVYTALLKETKQYVGYDAHTGEQLWIIEPPASDWAMYLMGGQPIAYGKFYTASYSGEVHAYDITNGTEVWTYFGGSTGLVTPYGQNPFCSGITGAAPVLAVADGKVYAVNNEHSPTMPLYKGYKLHAIDTETGQGIWSILGWYQHPVIADSYLLTLNAADNRIYSFGKGPSATTVAASPKVSVHESNVLVEGMVTDIAAGTKQKEQAARFPNGVPAVSDESMSAWMEYVYMHQPRPTNVTGIEVVIEVLDPNNNYYEVGRATTDANGMFHCAFTPEVPGEYTIIATFEGSESYWPSFAETALFVEEAPPATPAPTPTPAPMTDTYITGFGIVIIVAIAIVGFLLFRRRP